MPSYGIQTSGFLLKSLENILDEIEAEQLSDLSASANQSSSSVLGVLNNIFASQLSEIWEVCQAVYGGLDLSTASGTTLDYLAQLIGLTRQDPTYSTATIQATATGAGDATFTAGTIVAVEGNEDVTFEVISTTVISSSTTGDVLLRATETGALAAPALSLNENGLEVTITNLDSFSNAEDAQLGTDLETDSEFRSRIQAAQAKLGTGTETGVVADVLTAVNDLSEVKVLTNRTRVVDANGLPGNSVEVIVRENEATDDEVAQAVYEAVPIGILPVGFQDGPSSSAASGTAVDSVTGQAHTIEFSRAEDREVIVSATIERNSNITGGDTELLTTLRTAVAAYINGLGIGEEVTLSKLYAPLYSVAGISDVTGLEIGFSVTAAANLAVGQREKAVSQTPTNISLSFVDP